MMMDNAICEAATKRPGDSLCRATMPRVVVLIMSAAAAPLALGIASGNAQSTRDLMEGRGRGVSFPVSCGQEIQPRFDAALAALHSFWYGQALKEFTAIAALKPDCAMAHWGSP